MAQDIKEKYINPYTDFGNNVYRDINNAINTAKMEARAEGAAKANRDNARKMKAKGFSAEDIADVTGLTIDEIAAL